MPTGTETLRVSDADRERVAAALLTAQGEGRLTLTEFDERVAAAHAAVVDADLVPLTADLPVASRPAPLPVLRSAGVAPFRPGAVRPVVGLPGPCPAGTGSLRTAAAVWAGVSVVNLLVWVAVVVGTGAAVYPWWIWVAGPWGVVLVLRAAGERAHRTAVGESSAS